MDDKKALSEPGMTQMERAALVLLLARAGGSITYTEAEYQETKALYGGSAAIHIDVLRTAGQPPQVQLTLIRSKPAPGDLVS